MNQFSLENKVVIITGGAGLLGKSHAEAVMEMGGIPVLWDLSIKEASSFILEKNKHYNLNGFAAEVDITSENEVNNALEQVIKKYGSVSCLVNNACLNPKVEDSREQNFSRFENYSIASWDKELAVGLTGAMICTKIIGQHMSENGGGSILNVSSDLGVIAPDQRLYKKKGVNECNQNVKPVTYSVIKHGIIGLTKYTATYWADKNVRCNAIAPGGVYNEQPDDFVKKLTSLIPLGRMANKDEYKGSIQFLLSDASSYMTGAVLVVDGGRSCW